MFRLSTVIFAVIVGFAALILPTAAQGPTGAQPPLGFDYWLPRWMERELWGPDRMSRGMRARLLRHATYVNFGVPKDYDGARSTLAQTSEIVAAGGELYAQHCASCHGARGLGDGDLARSLVPSPALLAYMMRRPISVDEYLLWTISDGGEQFETDMPAFRDKLSREDIWKIVAYMRAGFPEAKPESKPSR